MIPSLLAQGSFWLDPPASTSAQNHDFVFYTLLYVMAFFFFLVVAIMLAFVVLYRRRKGKLPDGGPTHNTLLEIFWTVIPLGIVIAFFVVGMKAYVDLESPPPGADVIEVEASQWQFNFKYPNGAESNELYLQVNKPVLLKLTSKDVSHALYIPAFRVQRNAVPGRTTELWFLPTRLTGKDEVTGQPESYHVFCTQYCGNGHGDMTTQAYVLEKADYDARLAEAANIFVDKASKEPLPYAKVGEVLYKKMGCSQCHSTDGAIGQGPTWKGLYKRDHQFSKAPAGYSLKEGDDDAHWDAYLRESILRPDVSVVQGFQNVMPAQESALSGTPYKEKKLAALVEYIKSLDDRLEGGKPKYYRPLPAPSAKPAENSSAKPADNPSVKPPAESSGAKPNVAEEKGK